MQTFVPKRHGQTGPEATIQAAIVKYLRNKGWHVERIVGSMYQSGLPDLYIVHKNFGPRWVEVKLPDMKGSRFTKAQLAKFPVLCKNGAGVWVLTGATNDEYMKLMEPFNWWQYQRH